MKLKKIWKPGMKVKNKSARGLGIGKTYEVIAVIPNGPEGNGIADLVVAELGKTEALGAWLEGNFE